jgi:hypothetical protein
VVGKGFGVTEKGFTAEEVVSYETDCEGACELYVGISMEVVNVSFTLLYQTRPLREWIIRLYVRQVTE